jgi:hypothetical protein
MTVTDELIGNTAAAEYAGVSVNTWTPYVARGQAPKPVRREVRGGYAQPVWTKAQLDEWMANRPGVGAPGRPRAKRRAA